jgi:hypothetical protein
MGAGNETVGGVQEGSHAGRPSSWFAVGVMLVGFALGGVGLVVGPSWPLFWAGVAVAAVGGFLALAVGILSDVIVYTPVDIGSAAGDAPGETAGETAGAKTSAGKAGGAPAAEGA